VIGCALKNGSSPLLSFKIVRVGVSRSKEGILLLINNQEVEKLFTMKDCLEALEDGYDDLLKGDAVYRPRLDLWMPYERSGKTP